MSVLSVILEWNEQMTNFKLFNIVSVLSLSFFVIECVLP